MSKPEVITPERLSEIEARADKATEGPWVSLPESWDEHGGYFEPVVGRTFDDGAFKSIAKCCVGRNESDQPFIQHARTDIPALCATIRELWEQSRWIPVSEQLPDLGSQVQTWDGEVQAVYRWGRNTLHVYCITHWRLLPTPPQAERGEGPCPTK